MVYGYSPLVQVFFFLSLSLSLCFSSVTNPIYFLITAYLLRYFSLIGSDIYIYIYIRGAFNKFPDFFLQEFKIDSVCYCYTSYETTDQFLWFQLQMNSYSSNLTLIEHQFLIGIRDSRKAGSLWGMMRDVGRVRKSTDQSWLAKVFGLGLVCWGFKGVHEEIPSEEDSTLQIGSVAFPPGQCTSPQLHPCHRLFDQDWHQDSSSASL